MCFCFERPAHAYIHFRDAVVSLFTLNITAAPILGQLRAWIDAFAGQLKVAGGIQNDSSS